LKLIKKPNCSKRLFHVVFTTNTKSLKSVMQSFSQRWGSTMNFKHTMYCGLGKEVGRALPSNKKAPNASMKTQVVWLRRIKMKETYPAIKKQSPFIWRSYTCRPASLMASWTYHDRKLTNCKRHTCRAYL